MYVEMEAACTYIQAAWRGNRGRYKAMQHLEERFEVELENAALITQCSWRVHQARQRVARARRAAEAEQGGEPCQ